MSFLYPWFLLAALAIAIPIVIHLFNFRRYKKVLFPDIRFLRELQEQTQKHSRLKHLLILLSRVLAILALVLAFAQPYYSKDKDKIQQGNKVVSIYVDNSFSMGVEKGGLSMLDLAKGKAKEVIESFSGNDQFQILSNDFGFNENRFLAKEDALRQLSSIQLSATNRKAEFILEKQKQLLLTEPSLNKQLVYISDFQQGSFNPGMKNTDAIKKYFISVQAENIANITLDTAYFETEGLILNEPNLLNVTLQNHSDDEVNTSLSIQVNNQLKSAVNVSMKPREKKQEVVQFATSVAGQQNIKLFLQDNPVQFDDTLYLAGKVNTNYAVAVLNQQSANAFLSSVFKPNTQFRMDNYNIQSFSPAVLKNYTLVVLNNIQSMSSTMSDALTNYLNNGGALLVFAPQANQTQGINPFLQRAAGCSYGRLDTARLTISSFNRSHSLFRDIFTKTPENVELPTVYRRFVINRSAMVSEQKLFSFSNGDAFLSLFRTGNGSLYVCASSAEISSSNFPKSYWFLPMIYKMAYSNAASKVYATMMGTQSTIEIPTQSLIDKGSKDQMVYRLKSGGTEIIPEQRIKSNAIQLFLDKGIHEAGLYKAYVEGSKDSTVIGINYNRSESAMLFWKLSELKKSTSIKNAEWLEGNLNVSASVNTLENGIPLWKIAIGLALLFLLIEILLIRLMK